MKTPNFFIVGAPKCGTTSLAAYLRDHPDVFMCTPKEPHFFGRDIPPPHQRYIRNRDAYMRLYRRAVGANAIGEASVWYLTSESAPYEIRDFDPAARIIIMLRDPVEAMYSLYVHRVYGGNEDAHTFESALELEAARKKGRSLPRGLMHTAQGCLYRETFRYATNVGRYIEVFGRDQVKVILLDDFARNTSGAFLDTCEFLGVPLYDHVAFGVHNSSKRERSLSVQQFINAIPKEIKRPLYRIAPKCLRQATMSKLTSLFGRRGVPATPSSSVTDDLRRECEHDIGCLEQLLGIDLSRWRPVQETEPVWRGAA